MDMKRIHSIGNLLLWILQGFLIFLLFFQAKIKLPIQGIGHIHPIILHIPIGVGVLFLGLFTIKKHILSFDIIASFLLLTTAIFSTLTAIFGLLLAQDGGYEIDQLNWHQWSGVAVSFVYFIWVILQSHFLIGAVIGCLVLVIAGHTGGSITHGENFLNFGEKSLALNDQSVVFETLIKPILEAKCVSCHNDQKTKGALKMNSIAALLKGGKHGAIWKPGDPLASHFIQRINLPLDAKEHMPPKGKAQISPEELIILTLWVKEGASVENKLGAFSKEFQRIVQPKGAIASVITYSFSAASASEIAAVNTPYCTVYPIDQASPALQANFYVAAKFEKKSLTDLSKISEQLVGLNIAKMPISDSDLSLLANFKNLEKLTLNFTPITGKGLSELSRLTQLKVLSISGTKSSYTQVQNLLKQVRSIQEIHAWNTSINPVEFAKLRKEFPRVLINAGYEPKDEKLQINPPILINENLVLKPNEQLNFKHTLRDVIFHYTTNDSIPDSLSTLQTKGPISINQFTKVRILATKGGWLASNPITVQVFKSQFTPIRIDLLSTPDPKYPAHGAASLVDFTLGAREVKGVPNLTWLGFNETNLDVLASFKEPTPLHGLTLSYLEKTDAGVFPPAAIEVWAGNSPNTLRKIKTIKPDQPSAKNGFTPRGINIPLPGIQPQYIRLKAFAVKKLPAYLENKVKKSWLRVDELLFY